MGWFSRIEQPLVRDLSIAIWRLFCDVDLSDAKKSSFRSMRDCFIRELKEGARPIDPDPGVLVSPCDAIVGASGTVVENVLLQVKGSPYTLEELLCDPELAALYRNGRYATLAADGRHVPPLPRAATIAAWIRSRTSRAMPGTSIRAR